MNLIALSVPVFLLFIGIELLVARRRGLAVYRFDDAVTDLGCGIGQQATALFFKGLVFAGYVAAYEHYRVLSFPEGSALPWLVALVGVDFLYYWWHRASHEVAALWAVHAVHHQSEDYNLAVALRQAWFSGLTSWAFYLPLALLGVPPLVFAVSASLSTLYQFWIHTRLVGRLGPLEWVLNTPSHHRVHHGRNDRYLDRNYGATLIVWDRIFRSFREEDEEVRYGIVKPYESWNPVWANFDVWAELAAKARATPRLADKLRVWVKPPGWTPPGVAAPRRAGANAEPAVRYVTAVPAGVAPYVLAHLTAAVAATSALMVVAPGEATPYHWAGAVAVVASTLVWGGLFERRAWAVPLELARLALVAALALAAWWSGALAAPLAIAVSALAAGSGVWALRLRARLGRGAASAPALS